MFMSSHFLLNPLRLFTELASLCVDDKTSILRRLKSVAGINTLTTVSGGIPFNSPQNSCIAKDTISAAAGSLAALC